MFKLFNTIPSISTMELESKLKEKINIVDVRTSIEFITGHIKGAKNFPLNEIDNFNKNFNEEIYVICQSGMRSKTATKKLLKKGYKAINVKGGMNAWKGEKIKGR